MRISSASFEEGSGEGDFLKKYLLFGHTKSLLWNVACFSAVAWGSFHCHIWDLVPWPGIELWLPALEVKSLSHLTTKEVLEDDFKSTVISTQVVN